MKHSWLISLALFVLTAVGFSQYVETTVFLPDSILGLNDPHCSVLLNNNRLFVGGAENWVIGIDCTDNDKIGRIDVGPNVVAMTANPAGTKVYCAHALTDPNRDSLVTILNPIDLSVLAQVRSGLNPVALAYSERHNVLFSVNFSEGTVAKICGDGDSLIAVYPVPLNPKGIVYSEQLDRLYIWYWQNHRLTVMNGATGTIVDSIDIGFYPSAALLNPFNQRLYIAFGSNVAVVNCSTNTKETEIFVGRFPVDLAYDGINNRLVCALNNSDAVAVINGQNNQLLGQVRVGNSPRYLGWDSLNSRIIVSNYLGAAISIIDPLNLSVTATITSPPNPGKVLTNRLNGKTYVVHEENSCISVIDAGAGSIDACLALLEEPRIIFWNGGNDNLFCLTAQSRLYAIDGESNQVQFGMYAGKAATDLVADSAGNKVYVSNYYDSTVTVLAGTNGQVIKRIKVAAFPLCLGYNGINRKVYSCGDMTMKIIDATIDSVRWNVPSVTKGIAVMHNPFNNKVYIINVNNHSVLILDGVTNRILGLLVGGTDPTNLGFNLLNNEAYCTFPDSNWSIVIDDSSNRIIDTLFIPGYPTIVGSNGLNGKIYIGDRDQHKLYIFDPSSHQLVDSINGIGDPAELLWNNQDRLLYCSDRENNRVLVINPTTNVIIETLAVFARPTAMTFNPVYNRVYVMHEIGGAISVIKSVTGIEENGENRGLVPRNCLLENFPNPFSSKTLIRYKVSTPGQLKLAIYNPVGKLVKTLENQTAGKLGGHSILWSGKDESGKTVPAGVYIIQLESGNYRVNNRIILVR